MAELTKPLHVQVAEALGPIILATSRKPVWVGGCKVTGGWWANPGTLSEGRTSGDRIPRYDTDWSATGPLIEKYGLSVGQVDESFHESHGEWVADRGDEVTYASTPLVALCDLILALKAAGKL